MQSFRVIVDGDNSMPELAAALKRGDVVVGQLDAITGLPNGTSGGNPSVCFWIKTPDGKTVAVETTLKLFQLAAAALRGRYGDVT